MSSLIACEDRGAGAESSLKAGSCLEGHLTALLHTCHRLCLVKCEAWLLPHVPSVWDTLFAAFEAFCEACQQLCIASCAASAQEEQQHLQQQQRQHQQPSQQGAVEGVPGSDHQQTVAARIASYNAMAKAGMPSSTLQQPSGLMSSTEAAASAKGAESVLSGSCRLLMLLSKCGEMEGLLARLVPGFLAVLSFEGSQQVWPLDSALLLICCSICGLPQQLLLSTATCAPPMTFMRLT